VDRQEITEDLGHPGARNLLDSATLLRHAYNGSDGFPRVIPIGFYWNGNQIVVCTAATAPRVKALSSRPNVAMTVDVGDTPAEAKALLVRGLASVDIVDGVPRRVRRGIDEGMGRRPGHGVRAPGQVDVRHNVAALDLVFRPLRVAAIWFARDAHQGLRVVSTAPCARYGRALAEDVPLADLTARASSAGRRGSSAARPARGLPLDLRPTPAADSGGGDEVATSSAKAFR
jgi:hypothetical protein